MEGPSWPPFQTSRENWNLPAQHDWKESIVSFIFFFLLLSRFLSRSKIFDIKLTVNMINRYFIRRTFFFFFFFFEGNISTLFREQVGWSRPPLERRSSSSRMKHVSRSQHKIYPPPWLNSHARRLFSGAALEFFPSTSFPTHDIPRGACVSSREGVGNCDGCGVLEGKNHTRTIYLLSFSSKWK